MIVYLCVCHACISFLYNEGMIKKLKNLAACRHGLQVIWTNCPKHVGGPPDHASRYIWPFSQELHETGVMRYSEWACGVASSLLSNQ